MQDENLAVALDRRQRRPVDDVVGLRLRDGRRRCARPRGRRGARRRGPGGRRGRRGRRRRRAGARRTPGPPRASSTRPGRRTGRRGPGRRPPVRQVATAPGWPTTSSQHARVTAVPRAATVIVRRARRPGADVGGDVVDVAGRVDDHPVLGVGGRHGAEAVDDPVVERRRRPARSGRGRGRAVGRPARRPARRAGPPGSATARRSPSR